MWGACSSNFPLPLLIVHRLAIRYSLLPTPHSLFPALSRILGFTHRNTTSVKKFTITYVSPIDSKHPCTSA